MFTALLDTCVLWPSLQRDFILSLAAEQMFRPVWSAVILEELAYEEARKLVARGANVDEAEARAARLVIEMRRAFDDAEVEGWEPLEGTFGLPDANDEHVVAAAVVAGAGAIVTHNQQDFPVHMLPFGLEVILPARFAANTVELDPSRAVIAVDAIAARSGRLGKQLTPDDILDALVARYQMDDAVALIRGLQGAQ